VGETTRINRWTVSIGLERLVKDPVSAVSTEIRNVPILTTLEVSPF
jgi:hypothetical protein